MGLNIVYGRSGTGKSTYVLNEVTKKIKDKEKIYIITPEQFTFSEEEKLLKALMQDAVINAEVISFERMAYRIIKDEIGNSKTILSNIGKTMLVYDLLEENKKDLIFLGKTKQNAELVINTIMELKKHAITKEDLKENSKMVDDPYLNAKLRDISIIYEKFQNRIENEYIDENDSLKILANLIEKSTMFKDSFIYIDEFTGFTPQEYNIIEKLLKCAKQVTVTVCTDNLKKDKYPESDIFYPNKQTVEKLINLKGTIIEETVNLDTMHRFLSKELKHLEKNLYETSFEKYEEDVHDINLFLAKNPYSELENIASTIYKLVKEKHYRYNDIAIVTKNIDVYSGIAKAIFAKYNIPIFIDQKQALGQSLFVKYLIAFLEIFAKNWSTDAVLNYIKTGLCNITRQEAFILENYCIKWGINRSKWYKDEWHVEDGEENILSIRKKIVDPLIDFSKKIKKKATVYDITKEIYLFLEEQKIEEKLSEKQKKLELEGKLELASMCNLSWNTVINVLDEMVLVLGNKALNFEQYLSVLKAGLSEANFGNIPLTKDQVILGNIDRSRSHKIKALFLIGVNDGIFPSVRKEEGFLDDKDRQVLKQFKIELANGTKEQLYEENFNIYKALCIPEEKLYISYDSSDNEGKTLRPSMLITKLKRIFPRLIEQSDVLQKESKIGCLESTFEEMLCQIRMLKDGNEISPIWFEIFSYYNSNDEWKKRIDKAMDGFNFHINPSPIKKDIIEKINGNILKTSISRLEQYRSCPFSYYLKYGLKLEEKRKFQIQSLDTGTFMHDVIDSFFEKLRLENIDLRKITDDDIKDIINKVIDEKLSISKYYIFTSTSKFKILTNRLKRVLIKSMKYIIQTLTLSDFNVLGTEIEFKKGKTYEPIIIELSDGKKVEITGKIDRVDIAKDENGKYLRIIDYKSSIKNIDLNEVEYGLQLQLLTYLDAVSKKENAIPAGILYFNLIDPIIKTKNNLSKENIEEKIANEFKMQGLILADINVVKMMDKTLDKGASNLIPAYIDSKNNLSMSRSSSVSRQQFEYLQKYVNLTIKQIAEEIYSGNIDVFPYYSSKNKKTPCKYCTYSSICGFNDKDLKQNYNYIPNNDKQKVIEKIEGELKNV